MLPEAEGTRWVEAATLLGLPVGRLGEAAGSPALRAEQVVPAGPGSDVAPDPDAPPGLVVDLSSLWAGPLCAQLLGQAGARVVKVESTTRPDGARQGPAGFYDLLHAGQRSVALDLTSPPGGRRWRTWSARQTWSSTRPAHGHWPNSASIPAR